MPSRRPQAKPRRRTLLPADAARIAALLETWPTDEVVTWDNLADRVEQMAGYRWTRQTLEANEDIKAAYLGLKVLRRGDKPGKPKDPLQVVYERRIGTLESEIAGLRRTLAAYEELFARHQYNAMARGVSVQDLEAPLTEIDRRRTDVDPREVRAAKKR